MKFINKTIYLFVFTILISCKSNNGNEYVGTWEGDYEEEISFRNFKFHMLLRIKENKENNYLVTVIVNDRQENQETTDVYFYQNGCLNKNNEYICLNENDGVLIVTFPSLYVKKPITLHKTNSEESSKLNVEKKDSNISLEKALENRKKIMESINPKDSVLLPDDK